MTHADLDALAEQFTVAGRPVVVRVSALRHADGTPVFEVRWPERRPERLSLDEIAEFDRQKRQAVAALRSRLEAA